MSPNYTSRQQKIYEDYSPLSDEKLLSIVANRRAYNSDIIPVIKDILYERGLTENPGIAIVAKLEIVVDEKSAFIRQCIYNKKLTEPIIIGELENEFDISTAEAEKSIHSVYAEEKKQLKQRYFVDQPTDKKAILLAVLSIAIGIMILIILPILKEMQIDEATLVSLTSLLNLAAIVIYIVGIGYVIIRSNKLCKNVLKWAIASILVQPITLFVLAYSQYTYPDTLQKQIEPLRRTLREQLEQLNKLDDDYIAQRNAVKQKIEEKFYVLIYNAFILNNPVSKKASATFTSTNQD